MEHWKAAKRVMRYLQGTKDYGLTYRYTDHLEVVGYSDSDFAGCVDSKKPGSLLQDISFFLLKGLYLGEAASRL
jgi:hypothetical protein